MAKQSARPGLVDQMRDTEFTHSKKKGADIDDDDEVSGRTDMYAEVAMSAKILEEVQKQQAEIEAEETAGAVSISGAAPVAVASGEHDFSLGNTAADGNSLMMEDDKEDVKFLEGVAAISAEDEAALQEFMAPAAPGGFRLPSLHDVIKAKFAELDEAEMHPDGDADAPRLPKKMVRVYRGVGKILASYRSGALPKAFKIIPRLANWEDVLYITDPFSWTPQAMYQATRVFASAMKTRTVQRFYNLVLLPKIRDDIAENKTLNYHLYQALKKAMFKPAAWFRGLLLPMCEEGTCTLREAAIFSSLLGRLSVPVMHSSAAILKIAEMHYTGANSVFLKTLLNKKYNLPYKVVDAVFVHLMKFITDDRVLPVLWHQTLLVFVERYKNELTDDQKEALKILLKRHYHYQISVAVRRELFGHA